MAQSRTCFTGMDVHPAPMAVTDGANERHAEVVSPGAIGQDAAPVWCNPRQHDEAIQQS